MNAERKIQTCRRRESGIRYNLEANRYETPWGWIRPDFAASEIQVYGPNISEWFDAREALRLADLLSAYTSKGMAVALAIHQQYATWKGSQQLACVLQGRGLK